MEHLLCQLAPYNLRILLESTSLTLLLIACVTGQPGDRPTVYVRGIIRISYGAGRGEGAEGEWRKRSAEVECRGGTESEPANEIDGRERKRRVGEMGWLPETCLKIKALSWPRLIFHHTPKLKM